MVNGNICLVDRYPYVLEVTEAKVQKGEWTFYKRGNFSNSVAMTELY